MKGPAIGISLGARNARVAFMAPGGTVNLVPTRWGGTTAPSIAGWDAGWQGDTDRAVLLTSLLRSLREDAEVHLHAFVSACVLAVPTDFSIPQREVIRRAANAAGFAEAGVIADPIAAVLALGCEERCLVLDFGARTALSVVEAEGSEGQVLESVTTGLPGGSAFDAALAAWLGERLLLPAKKTGPQWRLLLREAERIKIALSGARSFHWTPPAPEDGMPLASENWPAPTFTVYREELERLIRFPLRQVVHTVWRLWTRYDPAHLILTGGSSHIPLLQDILRREGPGHPRSGTEDAVVRGAALRAGRTSPLREGESAPDPSQEGAQRLRELKLSLLSLETLLTRPQQDRLHLLFQRAEGASRDPEMLRLTEELVHDLKQAVD